MNQIVWKKPVCQLDDNGLYLGQVDAHLDINARDGSYIIPGGCIDAAPPEAREEQAARWTGSAWEYIPDHRGKTAYRTDTGEAVIIEQAGPVGSDLTFTAPPGPYHTWSGKKWAVSKSAAAEMLAAAKADKLARINAAAQDCIDEAAGLSSVPDFELRTWAIQALEAKAWYEDPAAPTPVLDTIAAARGLPPALLKQKAHEKAVKFELLTARIAGLRQAAEAKITAAATPEEVEAVQCDFCSGLPEETAGES